MLSNHNELMLRNAIAAGVVVASKYQFQKSWQTALVYGSIAYFVLDWAINLRTKDGV